jgi:uncharacterized membrane protein YgdD (TMEM256/DUF423 family)
MPRDRSNLIASVGAGLAGLSVLTGAFAAHALQSTLDEYGREIFKTAAHYQFMHSIALIVLAAVAHRLSPRIVSCIAGCFVLGVLVFSGSLYALALSGIRSLGAITPVGGTAFVVGWLVWAVSEARRIRSAEPG